MAPPPPRNALAKTAKKDKKVDLISRKPKLKCDIKL